MPTATASNIASSEAPELRSSPPDTFEDYWTCPKTGLVIPKRLEENLEWRQALRRKARGDDGFRSAMNTACAQSCHFWINAFGWTYRERIINPDGTYRLTQGGEAHFPCITWPCQDDLLFGLEDMLDKGDGCNIEKSRDMGATWMVLFYFDWEFLFHREMNLGVASRKEDLVDASGDMDSLFEKLRYMHRMLPAWMLPKIKSRYMHLHNEELNSTIAGESTNSDVGRGGRRAAYLLDEAAAIRNAEEIENSLSETTSCQVWVSTPKGPNTQFHLRIKEGRGRRIRLPWWRHPEKAVGAHQYLDELGRVRWTSAWYEGRKRDMSPKALAQEVDMDHGKAGDLFFDYDEIERHRQDHERPPLVSGDLVPREDVAESQEMEVLHQLDAAFYNFVPRHGRSPWHFWFELEDGRPPQYWRYVFGVDISNGVGSSNSVITVRSPDAAGRIVAKWWDAHTAPESLALEVMRAGVWFGGPGGCAYVIHENNGPGSSFGRKLVQSKYPRIYYQRQEGTRRLRKTQRYGWHSTPEAKELLLGRYRDELARDEILVPCKESLDEALDYIYDEKGKLVPSRLRDEPSGGHSLHGDHVIADALTVMGADELASAKRAALKAPATSFAGRRRVALQSKTTDPWS